jgi:hypothetical protein
MQKESLENKIAEMQNVYYNTNVKSTFYKNDQKKDCALFVMNSLNIEELFKRTVYNIPNTNHIFIDYLFFKTYANPSVYEELIYFLQMNIDNCITLYKNFELHININTFSPTAAQRYKDIIYILITKCLNQQRCLETLSKICLYNSPKMIDNIMKLFAGLIDEKTKSKIVFVQN